MMRKVKWWLALDDDDAEGGMAAGTGSGGEKRQRRRIAKGKCIMTFHNNSVVYDWSCIMTFNECRIRMLFNDITRRFDFNEFFR